MRFVERFKGFEQEEERRLSGPFHQWLEQTAGGWRKGEVQCLDKGRGEMGGLVGGLGLAFG